MNRTISSPVLLICFNRPDTTQIVFNSIREIQPAKLYVAIDGPRDNKPKERELCAQVLEVTKKVDWNCNVKYLVREKNLGCKLGVTQAITWALKNEDRIIIIEDDIVAASSFYYFADEMLEKYKNVENIAMISANNYTPLKNYESDYLFSKYGHIWGWATWKRAWNKFDVELPLIGSDIKNGYLKKIGIQGEELKYYQKKSKNIKNLLDSGKINTWDYQFGYFRVRNSYLSVVPKENLASNIGISSSRTNEQSKINRNYYPSSDNFSVRNHPKEVACDQNYDNYHFKHHINKNPSFIKRILRILIILKRSMNITKNN